MEKELLELNQKLNIIYKNVEKYANNILVLEIIVMELLYRICNGDMNKSIDINEHIENIINNYFQECNDDGKENLKDFVKQFIDKTGRFFL